MPFHIQRFAAEVGERLHIFRAAAKHFRPPVSEAAAVQDEARAALGAAGERDALVGIVGDRAKPPALNVDIAARDKLNSGIIPLLPERELLDSVRGVRKGDLEELRGEKINKVYVVRSKEGRPVAIYKPIEGRSDFRNNLDNPDCTPWREAYPPDTTDLLARERGLWLLDNRLGFGRVPVTTVWDGPLGPGSLQRFLHDSVPGMPVGKYSKLHSDQIAILDYVSGASDRNFNNYLTVTERDSENLNGAAVHVPYGIDNEFVFPRLDHSNMLRMLSDYVGQSLEVPLHAEALRGVESISPESLGAVLPGLGGDAVGPAAARLAEIQHRGMITGETWKAGIAVNGQEIGKVLTVRRSLSS